MHVLILTPDPQDPSFHGRWRDVFQRMAAPLEAEGVTVSGQSWDEATTPQADLILPLMAWGYHRRIGDWQSACDRWARESLPVLNAPPVLSWNADKSYLADLEARGCAIVPTLFRDTPGPVDLAEAVHRFGCEQVVVKPRVSASAYRTLRVRPGDSLAGGPEGPAIIQPYMASVERTGELSMIYLGGAFSHAIRKVARAGDFRVQPEYGGIISKVEPSPAEQAAAELVLKAAGADVLYARIDLVDGPDGSPLLIEAELIEPDLYLSFDPAAPGRFVRAVLGARAGGAV